jgi:integrase
MCGLRRSKVLGLTWDCVDLDHGEIVVQAGRVLLDGRPTDDPKSAASRRTVPVEEIQPGTVALLRSLRARQAADRLVLGGLSTRDRSVARRRAGDTCQARGAYSDRFAGVVPYG